MPRDAELLSDMSREMLRIARKPRVPAPPCAKDENESAEELVKAEKRKEIPQGFPVQRWTQMSKGYDAPEREYLAKRRRGLPPMHDGFNPIVGPVVGGQSGAAQF